MKITLHQIAILFSVSFLISACHSSDTPKVAAPDYPWEEYGVAQFILMHQPGEELFDGVAHPAAGLFEGYFNVEEADKEHQNYIKKLEDNGCRVITVSQILNEVDLEALRDLAAQSLKYIPEDESYRQDVLQKMNRSDLIRCILLRPTIHTQTTEHNTGVEAYYTHEPLMNLYFMRDQSITTPRGTILCKMNSSQRARETAILSLCYAHLGMTPYYIIQGEDSHLEGGDYFPFGTISLIGCGMRTDQNAINEMFEHDAFGHDTVIVVRDHLFWQMQMHLDTHFNIIDRDLVTMCQNRYYATPNDSSFLTCDIYVRDSTAEFGYARMQENIGFRQWLENRGITIITINEADEMHYANNYLTIAPRHICAIAHQSEDFAKALADNNVTVDWIEAENLIQGYGAAHCMTQVILRSPVK